MLASRIAIALGIVGAFASGLGIGLYVNESPLSSEAVNTGHPSSSGAPFPVGEGASSPGSTSLADGLPAGGPALVDRFWSCLTIPDETERQQAWLAMLGRLGKEDAVAVRELFRKMEKQGRKFPAEWEAFWSRWGMIDGAGALATLKDNESESWRPYAAEKLLRGWAQTNPTAAMEWLNANRNSPMYERALRGFVDGYAKLDLDRATQFVVNGKFGQDGESNRLMESLVERAVQQRQLGGMSQWFDALPSTEAKRAAFDHVYARLEYADQARAMDWVGQQANQPWRNDQVVSELAGKVAEEDPQAALTWASSLPPSPSSGRYNGLKQAVQTLAAKDPAAVERWLAQPDLAPALRDQGTAAYALQLQNQKSPVAEQWKQKVTDQNLLKQDVSVATRFVIDGKALELSEALKPMRIEAKPRPAR